MGRVLARIAVALALAGSVAACMPRGTPLTPEELQVVEANLVEMEARVTRQLRALPGGARPATGHGRRSRRHADGQHHLHVGRGRNVRDLLSPGWKAQGPAHDWRDSTARMGPRQRGWYALRHAMPCAAHGVRRMGRRALLGRVEYRSPGYQVYFGGPIEYWFRVSGPHHLDSGESDIVQGRAFYL